VVYFVETDEPVVALTIDDGPDSISTAKILDVLRQNQAHATFFLITGNIPGNEKVIHRALEEGHEIANHLTSDTPSILLRSNEFERRLLKAKEDLSRFSKTRWFRPGSGWYTKKMLSIIHKHGYECALGSVYPLDPQIPFSWFSTRYVLWKVKPGSVIVLHDVGARGERTAVSLGKILPELNRRGLRVVTLSELVKMNPSQDKSKTEQ
jgi:peptidoglycan/xylan/chitin deacetylase (PgdA/CDA1 family)